MYVQNPGNMTAPQSIFTITFHGVEQKKGLKY